MAQDKEFYIKIGGIKESIDNLSTLEEALSSIEKKVNTVNSNGGFTVASKESNKAMDELGKLTQKITQYDKEYQMAVEASKSALKDKNQEVKQAVELEKANAVVQEGAKNTYYEKQQLLSALGKQIKSMNADTEEEKQKQQELISQYSSLNQELKDFDASLGNHQRNVGDYGQATKNLKQELRGFQLEMANMLDNGVSKADPKFVELAKKAGALKDAMADAGEEINRFASDTKKLDDVINIAQSATAAFELYKGTMSAFGLETEATEEAIQKLMGAMSIIQSLQTLSETLQNGSATAKIFHKMLQMVGLEAKTAATSVETLATAEKGATVATDTLSVSAKALRLVLASLGIGLVIWAVTELVAHWEELCDWFDDTFPIAKKVGGVFNWLKAVVYGLGKSVMDWLVYPFKTFADVMGKLLKGDFEGAMKAAVSGVAKYATVAYTSFKEGYQAQIERGLEDITKKAATEQAKQTKYELDMLKARKGNQAKYSKEGIALQKKEFEQRRKAAKGNEEELKKIALDEASFFRECEEQKAAAAKKGAAARIKANKAASDEAKRLAKEEEERRKKLEEERKKGIEAEVKLQTNSIKVNKLLNKEEQRALQLELERFATGPIEKYIELREKLSELIEGEAQLDVTSNSYSILGDAAKEFPQIFKITEEGFKELMKLANTYTELEDEIDDVTEAQRLFTLYLRQTYNLAETDAKSLFNYILNFKAVVLEGQNTVLEDWRDKAKDVMVANKAMLDGMSNDAERSFKELQEKMKKFDVTPVIKDNIWGKLFGVIDEKKTLEKYEKIKQEWEKTYNDITTIIKSSETEWDNYIAQVEAIYTKDSQQYVKATQQKIDALKELKKMQEQVAKVANKPVSLGGDLNGDNTPDAPSGGTVDTKGKIQQGLGQFNDFMTKINDTLLAPMMDTFSMFMDFAIEETAQKLEQVEELHDKALDKVNESADKIKELNEALKDSGNDNMDATKQQLADEQLLYAQRLAEEKKLAEEERNLKNKQAQQEANARKMELRYQMVMGIANTAQGASKALAQWGWPLGAIFAGIMTALGLVQTALIAKQISQIKPVKYAEGGIINGKSHAQGGVPIGNTGIEVEGGEMVVSKKNTVKYIDVLTKINRDDPSVRYLRGGNMYADTRIRKFANGGQLNFQAADENLRANSETNRLMGAINDIDMSPVVSVVDIWKAENRLTKVRGLAGRSE